MRLIVNGKEITISRTNLSYQDGITMGLWKDGETVTYSHKESKRSGILFTDGKVEVEDGIRFDAMFTGNA